MILHAPNAQVTQSPRPWRVAKRLSVFGGAVALANLWVYTASGWQKATASVYSVSGWQSVLAAWVYTNSGWQQVTG